MPVPAAICTSCPFETSLCCIQPTHECSILQEPCQHLHQEKKAAKAAAKEARQAAVAASLASKGKENSQASIAGLT